MSLLYLLDSSACIDLIRRAPSPHLKSRFIAESTGVILSTIVLTELLVGVSKSLDPVRAGRRVERFSGPLNLRAFDADAAAHAADIRADLERRGVRIGPLDTLIAGHARSLGAVLVTGNLREFGRVDGLRVEDWAAPLRGFHE